MRDLALKWEYELMSLNDEEQRRIERRLLAKDIVRELKEQFEMWIGHGVLKKVFWVFLSAILALAITTGAIKIPFLEPESVHDEHQK